MDATPGPWTVDELEWVILGSAGQHVCKLYYPNTEANARLIATAPDLLAACELALPHLVNEESADAVRAAIAKATGGPG